MRTDLALVALVAIGCGARAHPSSSSTSASAPDAGDVCGGYALAVEPVLRRLAVATDRFSSEISPDPVASTRVAQDFAAALDAEERTLSSLKTGHADIDTANQHLVAAVGDVAAAVHELADGLAGHDDAKRKDASVKLKAAFVVWSDAAGALRQVCPGAP